MEKSPVHCIKTPTGFMSNIILTLSFLLFVLLFQGCEYLFPSLRSDKITVEEAAVFLEKHKGDKDVILIDIRSGQEFDSVRIGNSVNLDFSKPDFPEMISKLDKEKRYILVDQNGRKSAMAFELMKEQRFPKIHYIIGGINEWSKNSYPVQK